MKILVVNGPNLNMLGIREPQIYGSATYAELCDLIRVHSDKNNVDVEIYQSNHEGDLVDAIQGAYGRMDGIIINPAAYTHTSIALLDAVKAQLAKVEALVKEIATYKTGDVINAAIVADKEALLDKLYAKLKR